MWVFTKDGFFSVVENRDNHLEVLVRARTEPDIRNLSTKLGTKWSASGPLADYQYRIAITKIQWGQYLLETSKEIDYNNFKGAMSKLFGVDRMNQLYSVYSTMSRSAFDDYDFRKPVPEEDYSPDLKKGIAADKLLLQKIRNQQEKK